MKNGVNNDVKNYVKNYVKNGVKNDVKNGTILHALRRAQQQFPPSVV